MQSTLVSTDKNEEWGSPRSPRSKTMRTAQRESLIIAVYAALTALATYPLVLRSSSAIPRGADSWQNYWNLWWVKRALLEQHINPYFTPDLYFPYGATLYFHTLNLLQAVIAMPLAVTFGIPVAFNFLVFLSFVLSAYGANSRWRLR